MSGWEYGGAYRRHDMRGVIGVGTGKVQVWDLFDGVPEFMREADCVFVDPPCSMGNLRSFYTKADRPEARGTYEEFVGALFRAIDEIGPRWLYVEAFASNLERIVAESRARYAEVSIDESSYYHRAANRCWIVRSGGAPGPVCKLDEEDYIEWVCGKVGYGCIGDPCMGRGLVGWHAYRAGKRFVGTELNAKRLAVLVEKVAEDASGRVGGGGCHPLQAGSGRTRPRGLSAEKIGHPAKCEKP